MLSSVYGRPTTGYESGETTDKLIGEGRKLISNAIVSYILNNTIVRSLKDVVNVTFNNCVYRRTHGGINIASSLSKYFS